MSEVTLYMYIPFTCHLATLDTAPGAFSTEQAQDARTPTSLGVVVSGHEGLEGQA